MSSRSLKTGGTSHPSWFVTSSPTNLSNSILCISRILISRLSIIRCSPRESNFCIRTYCSWFTLHPIMTSVVVQLMENLIVRRCIHNFLGIIWLSTSKLTECLFLGIVLVLGLFREVCIFSNFMDFSSWVMKLCFWVWREDPKKAGLKCGLILSKQRVNPEEHAVRSRW